MENQSVNNENDALIAAEEILNELHKKLPLRKKIWFFLTCWRPVTKYEMARLSNGWVRTSIAVVNNYQQIQRVIDNMNKIVTYLSNEKQGMSNGSTKDEDKDKKDGDMMFR
jgi:hypothetical protein